MLGTLEDFREALPALYTNRRMHIWGINDVCIRRTSFWRSKTRLCIWQSKTIYLYNFGHYILSLGIKHFHHVHSPNEEAEMLIVINNV